MGQKINWLSILAMLISFSGVVVVALQGGTGGKSPGNRLGIVLALSTSLIWAFYFIQNARNKTDPVIRLFLNFLFATLYLLAGGILKDHTLPLTAGGWYSAIYVGVFEMGVTFVMWLMALQYAPTTDRISNLVYMAPFLNLFIVHVVLNEKIYMTTISGIILLVSGILIQNLIIKHEKSN
jgi:drug/metabolite transporter (DMT)-like permease